MILLKVVKQSFFLFETIIYKYEKQRDNNMYKYVPFCLKMGLYNYIFTVEEVK